MQRYLGCDIGFETVLVAIETLATDATPACRGKAHRLHVLMRGGGRGWGIVLVDIVERDFDARINFTALRGERAAFPIAIGAKR